MLPFDIIEASPEAFDILIPEEEYRARRLSEAMSLTLFRSWSFMAAMNLNGMVINERDAGYQWGSLHHVCALISAAAFQEHDRFQNLLSAIKNHLNEETQESKALVARAIEDLEKMWVKDD